MTEEGHMVPLVCTCSSFHLWYSYLAQSSTGHTRVSGQVCRELGENG